MTQPLRAFQDAFAQALQTGVTRDPTLAALMAQPGFSVYRNTVTKGCVDALVANYPTVARLVGDDWFRAAAAVFVRQNPPRCPMLVSYGDAFPDFLATFEPAAELPYLADVALLDRFWIEAHVAADQTPSRGGGNREMRSRRACTNRTPPASLGALEMVHGPTDLFTVAMQSRTAQTPTRLARSFGAVKARCWSGRAPPLRRSNCRPAAARSSMRVPPVLIYRMQASRRSVQSTTSICPR